MKSQVTRSLFIFVACLCLSGSSHVQSQSKADNLTYSIFMDNFPVRISGITFDKQGFMYVSESGTEPLKRILKIDSSRKIDTLLSLKCFAFQFLKAGNDNDLFFSVVLQRGINNASLFKISEGNKILLLASGFVQPVGITFDAMNNLYVVDAMLRKVFKITPDKEKSVFIDLDNYPACKDILYHGIDFSIDKNLLFIAGINISGGTGNLMRFKIDSGGGISEEPAVIGSFNCKQVVTGGNILFATANTNSLFIMDMENNLSAMTDNQTLTNGMTLSFGSEEFGENTLFINAFDRIVKVVFKP